MKAIIVDDEPKAIELIKSYLGNFKTIELVATFRNGLKAFEYLNANHIDLIFLDINMPHISGITLSKMIDKKIKLIFTTAYSEFAVESYTVTAVDYLLKPIALDRFMMAMAKVVEPGTVSSNENTRSGCVWIKSSGKNYKLLFDDIQYLFKEGNYITYFTGEMKVIARESITDALAKLPSFFCQTHKSYIVNTLQVTSADKDSLYINAIQIPLSTTFKEDVHMRLKRWS